MVGVATWRLVMKKEFPLSSAVEGFTAKLSPKYSGPYSVVKIRSVAFYDVRRIDRSKIFSLDRVFKKKNEDVKKIHTMIIII